MSVRWKWVGLWAAVAAAEIAALVPIVQAEEPVPGYRVVFRLIGGVFCACGLIAWRRRPDSRSGLLMLATGFGLFVEPVAALFDPGVLKTIGDLLEDAWAIPFIGCCSRSSPEAGSRPESIACWSALFVLATALEFVRHLFLRREGNFLLVSANPDLADALLAVQRAAASPSAASPSPA